jgi:prophage tail gpP-like protein/phage tail protein X
MSSSYLVIAGDTFETIARKQYGDETQAILISSANPGASVPLVVGTSLTIPDQPNAPKDVLQQAQSGSENEVAVLIDGVRFRFWESIRITRSMDAMDLIEFTAPFEPDQATYRETFRPFSYKPVVVTVGGVPLFTGTMMGVSPILEGNRRTVGITAYSSPGVLGDCTPPASAYPLEFNGQGLQEIATTLAGHFGLAVEFTSDQGAIFERVAAKVDQKVLGFLAKLAQQRNLVISSTPAGQLLFQQSVDTGSPVAVLAQGTGPVLAIEPNFNAQGYYSHVTGLDPVLVGLKGSQFTVKNERLEGVVRPFTFKTPDTGGGSVKAAVDAKAGRMFAGVASYSVALSTWRDPSGDLWAPNTTIKLQAPGAMIYNSYEFVIRSVEFTRDNNSETARLNLVLPGAFSGQLPETLPWDE